LTSAYNPESGTVNYTSYDGNGNLLSKTNADNAQLIMSYDDWNRLKSKSYSGATFYYFVMTLPFPIRRAG
jgi:YD repeat-containing protein